METSTTIISLGSPRGTSLVPTVATFEEAFGGEYSELRGKGRARRTARKADRQKTRLERKTNRIETRDAGKRLKTETRQDRRSDRKEGRVAKRIDRRATRKDARQDLRDDQQGRRIGRRENRLEMRQQRTDARQTRKDTKSQRELERDAAAAAAQAELDRMYPEETAVQQDEISENEYSEESDTQSGSSQSGSSQGGSSQGGSYGYDEDEEGYDEEEDWNTAPEGMDDEDYYEEEDWNTAPEGMDDEDYYEEDEDNYEQYNFQGEIGEDIDVSGESIDVPLGVTDAARKIEWNQEYVSRLEGKNSSFGGKNQRIEQEIAKCKNRIIQLQGQLKDYVNFEGEYDSADGRFSPGMRGKGPSKNAIRHRFGQVVKARNMAKNERNGVSMNPAPDAPGRGRAYGRNITMVEQGLKPVMSPQKIVVPASSNASGIGAPDLKYDNDIEVYLGTDGEKTQTTSKFPIKQIAIGVGVGIIAVIILKKYKII